MKKFYVLLAILIIGKISFAQVIFQENFQSGSMPSTFTLINDNNTVYSTIAALFPNAWNVRPEPADTTNKAAASPSWFAPATPPPAADRWMITPQITPTANSVLTWRGKAQDPQYPDGYAVKISTTGKNKADFTVNVFSIASETSTWSNRNFNLASYAGQPIYIAFIQNSTDMFYILIDDIAVGSGSGVSEVVESSTLSIYPNPAKDFVTINAPSTIKAVKVYNTVGQLVIEKSVKDVTTKVSVSDLRTGVYFVTIETEKGTYTQKINVL